MAGAGWAALSLSDEQVPPAAPDPTSTPTPSAVGGPQDHAVAGQILGLLSDNGLLVGSDFIRDYAGIERSANGWTLIFEGDDWITVEPRFAGSQLKITDMSSAFEADTRSLIGETVFLSTRRPRFSLGPPLFDRSENAVSIQAPFVWSGLVDDGRSLRGCAFEVSDSLGPVGRSSSSLLIPPPTSEAGRDGMLEDSVALPPTLPRTRALSMNLVCSGGVGRPVHPADGCSEGIDVPGTGVREHYPPKPSFEVFNMWTGTFAGDCLHVVAGRQQDRDISGPGLQDAHYYPGGALEVFGGYTHENRTESFESTLPHPIRLVDYRRSGENVVLVVQSLADCSLGAFRLKEAIFVSTPGWAAEREYPCSTEAEKRDLPTTITYDCFHAKTLPRSITFACADYGFNARHLVWNTWGRLSAKGSGHFVFKTFPGLHRRDGSIALSGRVWCRDAGAFSFERARIVYDRPWKDRAGEHYVLSCPTEPSRP